MAAARKGERVEGGMEKWSLWWNFGCGTGAKKEMAAARKVERVEGGMEKWSRGWNFGCRKSSPLLHGFGTHQSGSLCRYHPNFMTFFSGRREPFFVISLN